MGNWAPKVHLILALVPPNSQRDPLGSIFEAVLGSSALICALKLKFGFLPFYLIFQHPFSLFPTISIFPASHCQVSFVQKCLSPRLSNVECHWSIWTAPPSTPNTNIGVEFHTSVNRAPVRPTPIRNSPLAKKKSRTKSDTEKMKRKKIIFRSIWNRKKSFWKTKIATNSQSKSRKPKLAKEPQTGEAAKAQSKAGSGVRAANWLRNPKKKIKTKFEWIMCNKTPEFDSFCVWKKPKKNSRENLSEIVRG